MAYILSHQVLSEVLARYSVKNKDLTAIDKLFGGEDGYYWYHTLHHLCPPKEMMIFRTPEEIAAAVQGFENDSAAEDEVKPQQLQDRHLAAISAHLKVDR